MRGNASLFSKKILFFCQGFRDSPCTSCTKGNRRGFRSFTPAGIPYNTTREKQKQQKENKWKFYRSGRLSLSACRCPAGRTTRPPAQSFPPKSGRLSPQRETAMEPSADKGAGEDFPPRHPFPIVFTERWLIFCLFSFFVGCQKSINFKE